MIHGGGMSDKQSKKKMNDLFFRGLSKLRMCILYLIVKYLVILHEIESELYHKY